MTRSTIVRVAQGGDAEATARWAASRILGVDDPSGHPDYEEYRPDGNIFRVPIVEELVFRAVLAPVAGPDRVFSVLEPERMNNEAANLLLKTLEEPPPSLHLLFVTHRFFDLLPTVRSRCAVIDAPRLGPERAAGDEGTAAAWQQMAAQATARPATALAFPEAIERLLTFTAAGDEDARRRQRRQRTDELMAGLDRLAHLYRDVLALSVGASSVGTPPDPRLVEILAAEIGAPGALRALDHIATTREAITANGTVRLALEVLALRLGSLRESGRSGAIPTRALPSRVPPE